MAFFVQIEQIKFFCSKKLDYSLFLWYTTNIKNRRYINMKVSLSSINWDEYFGVKAEGGYGFPVDSEEVDSDDSSKG